MNEGAFVGKSDHFQNIQEREALHQYLALRAQMNQEVRYVWHAAHHPGGGKRDGFTQFEKVNIPLSADGGHGQHTSLPAKQRSADITPPR